MTSIKQRDNGRWRARYRDSDGREHARHFELKRDAQAWLDSVTASMHSGTYVDPHDGRTLLRDYYADWSRRQVWASNTFEAMDLAMRYCTFADVPLAKIQRSNVESWVKTMSASLAPSTIATRVRNVRSVLRAAVRDRYMPRDPSEGVALPRQRRPETAMAIPSPEQVQALLDAATPMMLVYLSLCAFAGLRRGEAAAVQLSDVDFLRRKLTVSRQVQRAPGGKFLVTPPKYGSERSVFLADELVELLSVYVAGGVRPDGWLFFGSAGDPPTGNTVNHWWQMAARGAGVSGFTLHDLRHFYASGLIAAGCDVVTVQRALGHAKASTTLNTYAHLWPSAEDRTRAAASELIRTSRGLSADSEAQDSTPEPESRANPA